MKIVILDGYTENPGDLSWTGFERLGELTVYDRTPFENGEILNRIQDAEIIYTNKTPLRREVLEKCKQLRMIGVLATGYNCVDVAYAAEMGVPVCNVPIYGTAAVGQFAMALLLEICHHIGYHDAEVHAGRWENGPDWCFWDYPLIELSGKTMGIIGFGNIGRATGKLAKAFGMRVLATGSRPTEEGKQIAEYTDLDTLLAESDVISLHCPALPTTIHMINRDSIAKMKDGVILLNNSRGQLIVEADLAEALENGKVRAAGVDVVSEEPIHADNPLLNAPNCIITPHISWASKESRERLMDTAVSNLQHFIDGTPENVVNASLLIDAGWKK